MAISNFIKNVKNLWNGTNEEWIDTVMPSLIGQINGNFNIDQAENISTVYTSVKVLAETLSRMPLNIYSDKGEGRTVDKEDYRYPILHYSPNNYTNSQTFIMALEYWRNLKGNSFAKINRQNGKIVSFTLLAPSEVLGYGVYNDELYYAIKNGNDHNIINASEILHFKGLTRDGIWGLNPIEALKMNLSTSYQGMQTLDNFYKHNTLSPKAIKSTIAGGNQKALLEAIVEFESKYAGSSNAGKMIVLPPNTDLVDMAMNFGDAEFINTFKFNAAQISSLFGVPPEMVGLFEASKFNNVEQMQINFKSNTMANIARIYRQEFEHKLLTTQERISGISIEFNTMAMVEMDATTRAGYLKTMANLGVISINDIAKLEGFKTYPEGEKHYMFGNYMSVEDGINNKSQTPEN